MTQKSIPVAIEDEMQKSYLDYAMSVIIGRALPDVRDGLKPVHRRIIYAMHELGLEWNKSYKKCGRIVGDVIGKFHPHGDAAAYDALTRLVQDFSLRYPLVDGQGNFGSIDGDPPAAYRYTEAKLKRISTGFLDDIAKETVNFVPNYEDKELEPSVLPAAFPSLLINGSSGIAVGMATNMPPHNLGEVVNAIVHYIDKPDATANELMKHVPGPDFPTGGFIYGREGITSAYNTGRGVIRMRARAGIENHPRTGRQSIVVTEIPYMVNKARLIEKMAFLVRDKKITGISDIRDESDREGMRIVVELKKDEIAEVVLNNLYMQTQMKSSFGVINLAIVDGQPKVLTLPELLGEFVRFRKEVVTRRLVFEVGKAKAREHILLGLKKAIDIIDQVIKLIRSSNSPQEARAGLVGKLEFSLIQAQAILDMRLQRLTALEMDRIVAELKELAIIIEKIEGILGSEKLLMELIVKELMEFKDRFGDERRTEIVSETGEISIEDVIVEEDMVVTISHSGYIKRNPTSLFRIQKRGGKGKMGMGTKEEDFVESLFVASTHSYILFFTDQGKAYVLKVYELPQAGRAARGKAIVNLLGVSPGEKITAFLPVRDFEEGKFILLGTDQGTIKKTDLMSFSKVRAGGLIAINLSEGERLIGARLTDGTKGILLATSKGQAIRFNEGDVREMGRTARGVRGIKLAKDDSVVSMEPLEEGTTLLTVTDKGYGKRTKLSEYRSQARGGSGIRNIKVTERNGAVNGTLQVRDSDEVMITTSKGKIIRLATKDVSLIGRNTQGVKLMGMAEDEFVTGVAHIVEKEEPVKVS